MNEIILYFLILTIFFISVYVFIKENKDKEQMPSLWGWSILALASALLLLSFFVSNGLSPDNIKKVISDNIIKAVMYVGNFLGTLTIVSFFLLQRKKNLSLNRNDKIVLIGVMFVIVFWSISKDAFMANIFLQALMVFGYCFFINAMIKIKKRLDPFLFWILALITTILSFPLIKGSLLASINTWRSLICVSAVLIVMTFYEVKNKRRIKK